MSNFQQAREYMNIAQRALTFLGSLGGLGYIVNLIFSWRNRRRLNIEYITILPTIFSVELTNLGDKDLSIKKQINIWSLDVEGNPHRTKYIIRERQTRKIPAKETKKISANRIMSEMRWRIESHWYFKISLYPTSGFGVKNIFYRHTETREQISGWKFYIERWLFKRSDRFRNYISEKELKKFRLKKDIINNDW